MPRSSRIDSPGLIQHVMVRGIAKLDIFVDDQDRTAFCHRLFKLLAETETRCYAWVLMKSHAHLLLQPTRFTLALLMRRLLTSYAVTFNLRHRRAGHLFQNRYKSIVCDRESYLLELIRYIHLNPLRAGIVSDMESLKSYRWSGHAALLEWNDGDIERELTLSLFGRTSTSAQKAYLKFLSDGVRQEDMPRKPAVSIKDEQTNRREQTDRRERTEAPAPLLTSKPQLSGPPPWSGHATLAELVSAVSLALELDEREIRLPGKVRKSAEARSLICYLAVHRLGFPGKEIGREINLGPAGVSRAILRGMRFFRERPEFEEELLRILGN